jgi:hypothetical protein
MKFILEIDLGNETMRNKAHISHALHGVASRILNFNDGMAGEMNGQIPDENGNTVGKWAVIAPAVASFKIIQQLVRSTATAAPTWQDTEYKTLAEARKANPGEYPNFFRIKREQTK